MTPGKRSQLIADIITGSSQRRKKKTRNQLQEMESLNIIYIMRIILMQPPFSSERDVWSVLVCCMREHMVLAGLAVHPPPLAFLGRSVGRPLACTVSWAERPLCCP